MEKLLISIKALFLLFFSTTLIVFFVEASRVNANEFQILDQKDASANRLFEGDQSGMFLWANTSKFCARIKANLQNNIDDTMLLFSDELQTNFFEGRCDGNCSIAEESAILRTCSQASSGKECLLYAAIRNGVAYDLTVSADGKKLTEVCNDN